MFTVVDGFAFGVVFFALCSIAGEHANDHTVIGSLAIALGGTEAENRSLTWSAKREDAST
ncbi:hypothetical protein [Edaphobacter sp.]|uniref:hypothetical protein n=1 Tax=Edaphobacter sp. TaxID=1934404 RepID=UPI002DB64C30|nr:hypothetical protein [Edaphobacter sp.]HEU5339622.1 hypothetical protein [Edaphobacter sp.]